MKRIISAFLALLMVFGMFGIFSSADEILIADYYKTSYANAAAKVATMTLMLESEEYGYSFYMDEKSGEFALKNNVTGEYLFSNPYDVAYNVEEATLTNQYETRYTLLSQLILEYEDGVTVKKMNSYKDAALNGQITYKTIKNGVRAEYAIGTLESKRLIPRWIEETRFMEMILEPMYLAYFGVTRDEYYDREEEFSALASNGTGFFITTKLDSDGVLYSLKDPNNPSNEIYLTNWFKQYPCTANGMAVYTWMTGAGASNENQLEALIREYCPKYTFDELTYDHELTGYSGDEKEPALFRIAVEYTIDEQGLLLSIPASGIRYNETEYTLTSVSLLPYLGCGSMKDLEYEDRTGGYTFVPDGSGTLVSFTNTDGTVLSGGIGSKVYGLDYTYTSLPLMGNQERFRIPVFGLVQNSTVTKLTSRLSGRTAKTEEIETSSGFVAIIEEGESLANIYSKHGAEGSTGGSHEYNTVFASFTTVFTDTINLGDTTTSGQNASMTVKVDTKYTGLYQIRYKMLTSSLESATASIAASKASAQTQAQKAYDNYKKGGDLSLLRRNLPSGAKTMFDMLVAGKSISEIEWKGAWVIDNYYIASYMGMANAYRDFLKGNGTLTKITQAKEDIPLYIASFGAIEIDSTFLTLPIKKMEALTTFDDIITMHEQLKGDNISNVNYKLYGFTNGGMTSSYPTTVSFEGVVGGKKDYKKLLNYASQNDIGIFLDFDFANINMMANNTLKGFSYRKHAALSIDDRYTTKRTYDAIFQSMERFGTYNIVATNAYSSLYAKFQKAYLKYGANAISVSSLGTDVSSDFDPDDPYSREVSKNNTKELLAQIKGDFDKIIVDAGNAYTLGYATDITNMALDSSNYAVSLASIPFMGIVLHGYVNYTGKAINMAGDTKYVVMKSIENGAYPYFILSYRNTEKLKEDFSFRDYYSVDFETWYSDLVKYYNEINASLSDLQTAVITDHQLLTAFDISPEEAAVLFEEYDAAVASYKSTKILLNKAMDAVDELFKAGSSGTSDYTVALQAEQAAQAKYNTAKAKYNLAKQLLNNYNVDNVVSVTYTTDSFSRTYYINYNTFDVVIRGADDENGNINIVTIPAETVSLGTDISEPQIISTEAVTAMKPTVKNVENFNSYVKALEAAMEGTSQSAISKAQSDLNTLIRAMANVTTENVVKVTCKNGKTLYINYNSYDVIIDLGADEASLAERYVVIEAYTYAYDE